MGKNREFIKEKLVVGILISRNEQYGAVKEALIKEYGPVDLERGPYLFNYTDYYNEEMDTPIQRWFLSFKELFDPSCLTNIKIFTNTLEERFLQGNNRKVNLDPGLMALSRFVLATTKNNAHRIALREGIFAEVTLLFRHKDFEILEWTYPDYQSRLNRDILLEIRSLYKEGLKQESSRGKDDPIKGKSHKQISD